jgi:hypothetical protein
LLACLLACVQMERLQKELDAAMEGMQRQKGEAKRWLYRQQVRLQAQAVEVQWERSAIAEVLEQDFLQTQKLLGTLEAAAATSSG